MAGTDATPGTTTPLIEGRPEAPFSEREAWRLRIEEDARVSRWLQEHIVSEDGGLHNPDHAHLELAEIGVMWTDAPLERRSKRIIGAAEIPSPRGNPITKLRQRWALQELDLEHVDFLITLDSVWCSNASDREFLALLEHELYHCGQATDENGYPRFNQRTGDPIWTIRAHDVEEFSGVVRRYGARAAGPGVEELVEAAEGEPEVGAVEVAAVCGTCRRAA